MNVILIGPVSQKNIENEAKLGFFVRILPCRPCDSHSTYTAASLFFVHMTWFSKFWKIPTKYWESPNDRAPCISAWIREYYSPYHLGPVHPFEVPSRSPPPPIIRPSINIPRVPSCSSSPTRQEKMMSASVASVRWGCFSKRCGQHFLTFCQPSTRKEINFFGTPYYITIFSFFYT